MKQRHGGAQLLINNAGVAVACPAASQSLEDWRWIVGVNLWGVIHGCHFFLPQLLAADEAHIVNVSSTFGIVGVPLQVSYCATKYAVRGLSEALRQELRHSGVGVTTVHPGGVATNIAASARSFSAQGQRQVAERMARFTAPEVVARRIVRAIRRDQARLICTPDARLADWLKRALPERADSWVATALSRQLQLDDVEQQLAQAGLGGA